MRRDTFRATNAAATDNNIFKKSKTDPATPKSVRTKPTTTDTKHQTRATAVPAVSYAAHKKTTADTAVVH